MADDLNSITQVRVDIGELKGILNTVVISHAGLIKDLQGGQSQLRTDLTAVKDNAFHAINKVATTANTNTESIKNLAADMKAVEEKQNASFGKVIMVLSPIIAFAALLWNVVGK